MGICSPRVRRCSYGISGCPIAPGSPIACGGPIAKRIGSRRGAPGVRFGRAAGGAAEWSVRLDPSGAAGAGSAAGSVWKSDSVTVVGLEGAGGSFAAASADFAVG